jgi:hypothetical protein
MSTVGFGNERGLVNYLLQEVEKLKKDGVGGGTSNTGLKKMVISITQISDSIPSITLLENNTSIDFSDLSIERSGVGIFYLRFNTTDISYLGKLFNDSVNARFSNDGSVCNVYYEEGGILKGDGLFWGIYTSTVGSEFSYRDGLLENSLFTIYVNE